MKSDKIVDVDVYTINTLPQRLATIAKEQGVDLGAGLIFVTTKCCPPSYTFDSVESIHSSILAHLHKVSEEEGVNLNEAVKRAFGDSHSLTPIQSSTEKPTQEETTNETQ